MSTKIIGNQIDATTRAIMEALQVTEQLNLPNLNQAAVTALGAPAYGTLVYNSTEDAAQIYKQDAQQGVPGWTTVGGGGPSVGENSIVRTNGTTISENLTIGPVANGGVEFTNGFSAGPITISNGFTVTIENGATWNIIGGQDDMSLEVSDVTAVDIKSTGILNFAETAEEMKHYTSSGNISHDFNDNNSLYVTRTGGSDYTLSVTNVPTSGDVAFGITVVGENQGGAGVPTSLNLNGVAHTVNWAGGSAPGMSGNYAVTSFSIINKPLTGSQTESYTVFGSGSNYG